MTPAFVGAHPQVLFEIASETMESYWERLDDPPAYGTQGAVKTSFPFARRIDFMVVFRIGELAIARTHLRYPGNS